MAERTGKCTRFGNCSKADTGVEVTIPDGADPVCPECGKELLVNNQGNGRAQPIGGVIALVVIALLVVAALGFAGMRFFGSNRVPPVPPVTSAPAAPAQIQPPVPVARVEPTAPPPPPPSPVAPVYEDMVRVADFWIDKTEVSIGEFKALSPGYKAPKGFTDDMPVVDVTWEDARRFSEKSGKRLCKESEWLFALGEVRDPSAANLSGDTMDRPRSVSDERDRNSHGLLNMVGNVSEWVDSGAEDAAFAGGYWYWNKEDRPASDLKSVHRLGTKRNYHHYIGFRSCRDAGPTSN